MSETSRSGAGESMGLGLLAPPAWAVALPLWAGVPWLWLAPAPNGSVLYRGGGETAPVGGQASTWDALPLTLPFSLLVLDGRAVPAVPAACWPALARGLTPGGLLFVCGLYRPGLREAIRAAAPTLQPADWHLITPSQDGAWHLRPEAISFHRLMNRQLDPAYSARAWLRQMWRILRLPREHVPCLPVWRESGGGTAADAGLE